MGLKIICIPAIKMFSIILLSVKFAWADFEGCSFFKFLDSGISNEKMIPLSAFSLVPARLIVPFLIAKYVAGANPTDFYLRVLPFRTFFCLTCALIVWMVPFTITDGVAPNYVYVMFLLNDICYITCSYSMHITITAVFIRISDPAVGGTYMTLMNTIDNFGGLWPVSLSLWAVEYLTWRDCGVQGNEQVLADLARNGADVRITLCD